MFHRIPETPHQGHRARHFLDRRSWLGSSHEERQRFCANAGGALVLLPPYSPDRNPDDLVWKHVKADTVGRMAVTGKFSKKVCCSMCEPQNDARKNHLLLSKGPLKYAA
jgi:hypothetical protein